MTDFGSRLNGLRLEHERLLREFRALAEAYESQDLHRDNEALRGELAAARAELEALRGKLRGLQEENVRLRTALHDQIVDEKLSLIKLSRKRLETYFASETAGLPDRLTAFAREARKRIADLAGRADRLLEAERQAFLEELNALDERLSARLRELERRQIEERERLEAGLSAGWEALAAEGVDETVIGSRMRQSRIEMKIGLNWVNRIGILLILFGVGAAFRYSYAWFSDHAKGAAFFLLGLLMLAGGERFVRRRQRAFGLGLAGGGAAVLYADIFYSHFLLGIIGRAAGLLLAVAVTVLAAFLSLRYHSRTICLLALVGGYLPLYSYLFAEGPAGAAVHAAMGYLLLLNVFVLALSFRQRWRLVHAAGFLLNVFSSGLLSFLSDRLAAGMLNVFLTFILYQAVVLGYPFIHRMRVTVPDLVLLGLNAFFSASFHFLLLEAAGRDAYAGAVSLLYALAFLACARLVGRLLPEERQTKVLFDATSLSFAIAAVPFQFGARWLSLGWLVESLALILAGIRHRLKWVERAGWGLLLACLAVFLFRDVLIVRMLFGEEPVLFNLKYTSVTAGLLLAGVAAAWRRTRHGWPADRPRGEDGVLRAAGHAGIVNLWLWLLHELKEGFDLLRGAGFPHPDFYQGLSAALATMGLAYALGRIRLLKDRVTAVLQGLFYGLGCFIGLAVTLTVPVLEETPHRNTAAEWVALLLLAGFNALAFLAGREPVLAFVRRGRRNAELVPLVLGLYLVAVMTGFLIVQFRLAGSNLAISLMYLGLAAGFVLYGFRYRYVYIRRLGLGLSLAATAKLFLYDLMFLGPFGKVVAYFGFGLVLIGISYMYQRLTAREQGRRENGDSPGRRG